MKKFIAVLAIVLLLSGCATVERFAKDTKTEFAGGLERVVKVYDYNNNLLATYEGKIDVKDREGYVLFELNGQRIIIYNAIVIVEEN